VAEQGLRYVNVQGFRLELRFPSPISTESQECHCIQILSL